MKEVKTIIVLDDDPTGTQTVHGVPVITNWEKTTIETEYENKTPLFYILTNSRALVTAEAEKMAFQIGSTIKEIGKPTFVISRGDSTLRGHFPEEVTALATGLGWENDYLIVLAPAFFEGNRFTKDDIHYVKEGEEWIPAAETPYAKDKTFGYTNSNIREWVVEKSKGKISLSEIDSVSISELESFDNDLILNKIEITPKVLIVNALSPEHLEGFVKVLGKTKRHIVFRTAASFVPAIGEIAKKPLLEREDFLQGNSNSGGLIVVGSHVPKTTQQLNALFKSDIEPLEFEVEKFLIEGKVYFNELSRKLNEILGNKKDVVLYTSRQLVSKRTENESLILSVRVSLGLIFLVQNLAQRPAFLIAKGGITSSDVATKGLGIQRALVLGQILPGVPVWQADQSSRFPDLTYVVFPGNVGDEFGLLDAYNKLNLKP
ncbi:four-carbon acid sugar kinase family protein [Lacihabitans lacunae]|uniref:Four-carbon acid sugar kinase family protein n=1 Tax=Lacihabitans lacunae TaxID=1028214 RepID=A0ABV7YRD4_9BACT